LFLLSKENKINLYAKSSKNIKVKHKINKILPKKDILSLNDKINSKKKKQYFFPLLLAIYKYNTTINLLKYSKKKTTLYVAINFAHRRENLYKIISLNTLKKGNNNKLLSKGLNVFDIVFFSKFNLSL